MSRRLGAAGGLRRGRTPIAALLVLGAVALPTAYWYAAESRAVAREVAALLDAPRLRAEATARRLAASVESRLAALLEREDARPFFHYQNLYVDPRGAYAGPAVAPSPLADGPPDPLVAGNFQVTPGVGLTLPTYNPEIAELNASDTDQSALRERLARAVSPYVERWFQPTRGWPASPYAGAAPVAAAVANAALTGLGTQAAIELEQVQAIAQAPLQEQRIPSSAYLSNQNANEIWRSIQASKGGQARKKGDGPTVPAAAEAPAEPPSSDAPLPNALVGRVDEVVVRVGPLGWHTVAPAPELSAGEPVLVALRRVETPDGVRVQGFEVALPALAELLADAEGAARLAPGEGQGEGRAPVRLGGAPWHVAVDFAGPAATAAEEARALSDAFAWRFAVGAALAALAGAAVVLMIAHAERLSRRRVQFAASAAHELRTPLAGVRMYGEMLAEGLGNPERQRLYARRVASEADRLGRVVSNVLDFTRLERGNLAVAPAPGDVAAAVSEIAQRLAPTLAQHGATLTFDLDADLPPTRFDKDALAQVLSNLVDNAEKYGRAAADRAIALSARAEGPFVVIGVRDHGPGIGARLRRRLFRPFARGTEKDHPAGLGLGLALSRALVEAQGGRLSYRDAPGGGAEFVVSLPTGPSSGR